MTPTKPTPSTESAPASLAGAPGSGADDDDYDIGTTVDCGLCGDDGWIMLSDAGPSEWGEDCFCEIDRPIPCPECSRPKRPNSVLSDSNVAIPPKIS